MASKSLPILLYILSAMVVAQLNQAAAQHPIIGGWETIDPKDPEVVRVAKFAVTEHNKEANASLTFISVYRAERQLVAGWNYRLLISAKNSNTGITNNYQAIVWSQPWIPSLQLTSFKPILKNRGVIVGDWRPIENLSDPEVLKVAKFAVAEHNREANTTLQFVSIVKGDSQIVAGVNYRLVISTKDSRTGRSRNYQAVVWSQPWHNFLQLVSFQEYKTGPLLGGYTPIKNLTDPEVVKIAKFAITEHNKDANTTLEFITIIKGDQQVVAGMNYRLVIVAKDGSTGKSKVYQAVVWSKPWENFLKLISFQEVQNRTVPGGWSPIENLNDPEVVKAGKFAIEEHNKEAHTNLEFVAIVKGDQQVVAGVNYRLVIVAKDGSTGKFKVYQAVVWSKPWEPFLKLISFEEA